MLGWFCTSRVFLLSRGFSFVGSPAHARCGVLYSDTLSARDVGVPRPTGLLTARVLVNSGSALPRVSTRLLLLPVLRRSYLGLCSSPLTPARLSRAPHSGCDSPPWPLPGVSPFRRKARLSRWLVYCSWSTIQRSHDITHPHSVWSHLQRLANCSYPNGRRPAPSLHLFTRTWIQLAGAVLSKRTHWLWQKGQSTIAIRISSMRSRSRLCAVS